MPLLARTNAVIAANAQLISQYDQIGKRARQLGSGFEGISAGASDRFGQQTIIRILVEIQQEQLRLRRGILDPQTFDPLGLTSGG